MIFRQLYQYYSLLVISCLINSWVIEVTSLLPKKTHQNQWVWILYKLKYELTIKSHHK